MVDVSQYQIVGDHVLYGDWDDCSGNQFLVYYHPNGIHCTVFMMGGFDYGGGVTRYADMLAKDLAGVTNKHSKAKYELYHEVDTLVKASRA